VAVYMPHGRDQIENEKMTPT